MTLKFTGERYVPEQKGSIEIEHLHRYALAKQLANGKRVLDLACGEGYGSYQLSEVAFTVTGIDVDIHTVAHAKARYQKANLFFLCANASSLPLVDQSLDLVVSFETIEHLVHQDEMLAEIRRVLDSKGTLLISSPNKLNYSDANNFSNPYHVKELYREDFETLLRKHFKFVTMAGQRIVYGSLILPDYPHPTQGLKFGTCPITVNTFHPTYDLAIASNSTNVSFNTSVLESHIDQSELVMELLARVKKLEIELMNTYESRSWQITAPLRWCFHRINTLMDKLRRIA